LLIYVGLDDRDKVYEQMELVCRDRSNFPNIPLSLTPAPAGAPTLFAVIE
jgi:hypothetical protein